MTAERGVFVTLEGGEGTGKSTQLDLLLEELQRGGIDYLSLREPGGTVVGERVRAILLDPEIVDFSPRAELLLFGAARAQIVDTRILPALEKGKFVVCDRFFDSTEAYQVSARGLDPDFVYAMRDFAPDGLVPDMTICLDISPNEGLARATTGGADRMEQEDLLFHERVREGFLRIAEREPNRFKVVDAKGSIEEVHSRLMALLQPLIERLTRGV